MKKFIVYPEWLFAWNATSFILLLRSLARDSTAVQSWQTVTVALVVVASATLTRWMLHRDRLAVPQAAWSSLVLTPGAITFAFWLSTLSPSMIATVALWTFIVAGELGWLVYEWRAGAFSAIPGFRRSVSSSDSQSDMDAPLANEVDSQIERRRIDGQEQISGLLRVRYEQDQRHATVFAGFVPPLRGEPNADSEVVWGNDASAKIVELHAQGVRFEVSRDGNCDDEGSTIIEFFAQSAIEA